MDGIGTNISPCCAGGEVFLLILICFSETKQLLALAPISCTFKFLLMCFFLLDSTNYVRDFHFISFNFNCYQIISRLCWWLSYCVGLYSLLAMCSFEVTNFVVCDMVNDLSDYYSLNSIMLCRDEHQLFWITLFKPL